MLQYYQISSSIHLYKYVQRARSHMSCSFFVTRLVLLNQQLTIVKFQYSFLQRRARYNKDLQNVLLQFASGVILKNALRPCRVSYYKLQSSNILTFFSKLHILHVLEFLLLSYSIKVVDQNVEKFSADIDTLDLWILLVVKYF